MLNDGQDIVILVNGRFRTILFSVAVPVINVCLCPNPFSSPLRCLSLLYLSIYITSVLNYHLNVASIASTCSNKKVKERDYDSDRQTF